MTNQNFTKGEISPHPNPPPPRGREGWGEDNQVSFLCNVKVKRFIGYCRDSQDRLRVVVDGKEILYIGEGCYKNPFTGLPR